MLQLKALLKHHPWRFLLYAEWTLLLIVALGEVLPFSLLSTRHPLLNWACLLLFAAIGLRLPTTRLTKIAYTSLEFVLVLVASIWGGIHLTPLLYIVLVIRNGLLFNGKTCFVVLGLTFVAFLLTLNYRFQSLTLSSPWLVPGDLRVILLTLILLMGIVLVFSQILVERALAERQNQAQLATVNAQLESANTQLRQYALRIEDLATVQERNRIAREIHDALGHSLTVFNLHLEAALRLLDTDPAEAKDLLMEVKQLGRTALNEVRQSVAALRSDPLQAQPLAVAITALVAEFQRSTGVTPLCKLAFDESVAAEIKTAVYRIVQESLTNIYKYAEATRVKIEITTFDHVLQMVIEDNGKGFNLDQNTTGFGLQGMRERAQALRGTLKILTSPGTGCRVILGCPLS
ncbi:MAG: sensor histidine kinase [Chroococcidiopsidaceae cyanobacterium CP_BM_RX_35]|nr:sensor histidine kinase [Chroococcidiopsidaceae cyanobacterium CP_BM_RX_35]